jgi:hypothetical protein
MKHLSDDSQIPGQGLNPGHLEYEAEVLTARQRPKKSGKRTQQNEWQDLRNELTVKCCCRMGKTKPLRQK